MKKTLLATAIAGAIAATGMMATTAQAATVYDQDGTKLDLYGRLAIAVEGGGNEDVDGLPKTNGTEFVNMGSRFGLRGSQQVNSDLSAYGRIEFRFNGDERNSDNLTVRNSYLGVKSNQYGSLQAGNFDNFYLNTVSAPFDVYINKGFELSGYHNGQGDSLGYISPNLEGFQVYLMGRHYTGNGTIAGSAGSNSSEIETAGGAVYEVDALRLGLGYSEVSDDKVVGGSGETIFGASAVYAFTPAFAARLAYETQDDNEDKVGLGATYSMDAWKVYADYYYVSANGDNKDILNAVGADTTRHAWAAGTTYNVSSNFQLFAEVYESDQTRLLAAEDSDGDIFDDSRDLVDNVLDIKDNVYWMTGARYFF
ncbi:porin [Halomonas sp.]|uniref:porin n=1 Tax=Halomonas sp. TaxID=1486246 RepID=UPI00384F5285